MRVSHYTKLLFAVILALVLIFPPFAVAEDSVMTPVRVGAVEQDGMCMRDANGVARGKDAEYLARLSQYALLEPEYVFYDNFSELLNAMERGDVVMAMGLSKTPEREERFLFSDTPIAQGTLYVKIRADDDRYDFGNINQLSEMRLGYTSGSSLGRSMLRWAEENEIELNVIEMPSERELDEALADGRLDAVISTESLMSECRAVFSLNTTDYFAAFNRDQQALKRAVDQAMYRINSEDRQYNANLYYNKDIVNHGASVAFTAEQKACLATLAEKSIRVAIVANDVPFSVAQSEGIVRDFYTAIQQELRSVTPELSVEYSVYATFDDAVVAVTSDEADVLGMTRLNATEACERRLIQTCAYQPLDIVWLRLSGSDEFKDHLHLRAAVLETDRATLNDLLNGTGINYDWIDCEDLNACVKALQRGAADVIVTSLTQATWLINQHRGGFFDMTTLPNTIWAITGAVSRDNHALGEILSRASESRNINLNDIIIENTTASEDIFTFIQRMSTQEIVLCFLGVLLVALVILLQILRYYRLRERARESSRMIQSQKELLHAYEYDVLTGLPNRNTLMNQIKNELQSTDEFTVAFIQLNELSVVNESYGYAVGDQLLMAFAARLQAFSEANTQTYPPCRFSGNEFLCLFDDAPDIAALCAQLAREVAVNSGNQAVKLTPRFTIGVAHSDGASTPEHIVQNATMAANTADSAGANAIINYDDTLRSSIEAHRLLIDSIDCAIREESFDVVYQPQVNTDDRRVEGFEALCRFPGRRYSPDQFIPVAESSGTIVAIDRIVTKKVVQQLSAWKSQGFSLPVVSINFSWRQLEDHDYVHYLASLLNEYDIPASSVKLEITESGSFHVGEAATAFFRDTSALGVHIALDDYGSGYSTIMALTNFPVDDIKFDKSLVEIYFHPNREDYIRRLVEFAHLHGKRIIVEGIETEEQVRFAERLGIEVIQGYYFSRPVPAEEAILYRKRMTLKQ